MKQNTKTEQQLDEDQLHFITGGCLENCEHNVKAIGQLTNDAKEQMAKAADLQASGCHEEAAKMQTKYLKNMADIGDHVNEILARHGYVAPPASPTFHIVPRT